MSRRKLAFLTGTGIVLITGSFLFINYKRNHIVATGEVNGKKVAITLPAKDQRGHRISTIQVHTTKDLDEIQQNLDYAASLIPAQYRH